MKIPLCYPKIPDGRNCPLKKCVAFEKYDGTNFHWILKPSIGFCAFGTRRDRYLTHNVREDKFLAKHPELQDAPETFWRGGFDALLHEYYYNKFYLESDFDQKEIILFTEFFGPSSFAGRHKESETKKHVIIDIMIDKIFLSITQFIKECDELNKFVQDKQLGVIVQPKILYQGKYTGQFVEDVRKGKYTKGEGVVCKGEVGGKTYMTKIKTDAYLEKLKEVYPNNWEEYWE